MCYQALCTHFCAKVKPAEIVMLSASCTPCKPLQSILESLLNLLTSLRLNHSSDRCDATNYYGNKSPCNWMAPRIIMNRCQQFLRYASLQHATAVWIYCAL